jgi:hypothetical protein
VRSPIVAGARYVEWYFDDLGQDLVLVSNAPNNGQGSDAHLLLINGNSGLAMKPTVEHSQPQHVPNGLFA